MAENTKVVEEALKKAFGLFDKTGDGKITHEEVGQLRGAPRAPCIALASCAG